MISEPEAINASKKQLDKSNIPYDDREIEVSLQQTYQVVFKLPPDMLGGDFTFLVDTTTGEVISTRIER